MFVITVFSHQWVREGIYRAGRRYHVQTKDVELREGDNYVGIYVDASEILMTCQGKLEVAVCVGCLVVAVSEALQRFRPSGNDKVSQPAMHRETGVSKFCAALFQIYFIISRRHSG